MKYYVRALVPGHWEANSFEELQGDAVCNDWNCSNASASNTWSLFELDSELETKNDALDYVALRMLVANFQKYRCGIDFVFLDPSLFQINEIFEDMEVYHTKHLNYQHVNLKQLNAAVLETFAHRDKIVSYNQKDLASLLRTFSGKEDKIRFLRDLNTKFGSMKPKKLFEKINNHFFFDEQPFPVD